MKIVAFTKSFQDWTIAEVCRRFREIGLDGVDLTVRPGGMIEPKSVAEELPVAVRAAAEAGTEIAMLTTAITEPNPEAEKLLETAGKLGIGKVKLGYYRYKPFGTLVQQMDEVRKQLAAVVKMARKFAVFPCVHTHSGAYIPSHGTMLYELIRDFRPDELGAYGDAMHMVLEGGGDGWRQGLDLLAPWLSIVGIKNFTMTPGPRDPSGRIPWKHAVAPLADGVAPIGEFVATLQKAGFDGICSLHSEYKGRGSFQDMSTEECLQQTVADLKFFKQSLVAGKEKKR